MTAASDIRFCLTQCRTIAVVGLSPADPDVVYARELAKLVRETRIKVE